MSKIRDYISEIETMLDSGIINTGEIKKALTNLSDELNELENDLGNMASELENQSASVTKLKDKLY